MTRPKIGNPYASALCMAWGAVLALLTPWALLALPVALVLQGKAIDHEQRKVNR